MMILFFDAPDKQAQQVFIFYFIFLFKIEINPHSRSNKNSALAMALQYNTSEIFEFFWSVYTSERNFIQLEKKK